MNLSPRFLTLAGVAAALMAAGPPPSFSLSPAPQSAITSQNALNHSVTIEQGEPQLRNVKAKVGPDYTLAPMPNSDAAIPFVKDPRQSQAQLAPSLFAPPSTGYRGEGYMRGSTAESEQQRKLKPTPGVNLLVPLN